MQTLKQKIAMH